MMTTEKNAAWINCRYGCCTWSGTPVVCFGDNGFMPISPAITEKYISYYCDVINMSGVTRRTFIKGAAAAAVGATAGCVGDEECSPDTAGEIGAEPASDEDVAYVLDEAEEYQREWLDTANEGMMDRGLYDGPLFDTGRVSNTLYAGSALDPDNGGSDAGSYDVLCRVETDEDGPFEDLHAVFEETPDEASMGASYALETLASPIIHLPVERQDNDETDHRQRYADAQQKLSGIRTQVVDQHGNYVEAYLSADTVRHYTEQFETEDPVNVYRDIGDRMSEDMETHFCEQGLLEGLPGASAIGDADMSRAIRSSRYV